MAKWHFWGEKEFSDVYENIYIRGLNEDWLNIVFSIAKEISLNSIFRAGATIPILSPGFKYGGVIINVIF